MAHPVNTALAALGLELRRVKRSPLSQMASLTTSAPRKGIALLAYILEPFLLKPEERPSQAHTHHTESLLMAQAFLELGYDVDVIDYRNHAFRPARRYDFLISARSHFAELAQRLPSNCIKIAHLDTAHFAFSNAATFRRLLELQQRRGVTVPSIRVIETNLAPENADYLTVLGNDFTEGTYRYAGKPIFRLLVPTPNVYPNLNRDFDRCRNHFLWLGSQGFVHKGLDLVLEAFSGLPDHHLTVCGPVDDPTEAVFCKTFQRELYATPNIYTHGWVDVSGSDFLRITGGCIGLIFPSCAEANCGSVITCLQAGLIPLISCESGVDVFDFGAILHDCSPDGLRRQVKMISSLPASVLKEMSNKAQDYARAHHTGDVYLQRLKEVIENIEQDAGRLARE